MFGWLAVVFTAVGVFISALVRKVILWFSGGLLSATWLTAIFLNLRYSILAVIFLLLTQVGIGFVAYTGSQFLIEHLFGYITDSITVLLDVAFDSFPEVNEAFTFSNPDILMTLVNKLQLSRVLSIVATCWSIRAAYLFLTPRIGLAGGLLTVRGKLNPTDFVTH